MSTQKFDLLQFRSPTDNGFSFFRIPSYTNTMGRENNTSMRDTYMPNMRGMNTWKSSGIKANIELPKTRELRVDPPLRMSDHNNERKHYT